VEEAVIQAVTYDFWDCIVQDESDEPKRSARGLPTKVQTRLALFRDEVLAHHPEIGAERCEAAFDHLNARFRFWWKEEHRTPSVEVRIDEGYSFLQIARTPGFGDIVAGWETMEVDIPPDLSPNVEVGLKGLKERGIKIGIVSDAIVTPGTLLRSILEQYELLHYFDDFVFSDEAGASKPDRKVFDLASKGLGVPVSAIAHLGDREYNDIGGPLGCGATGILYTGAIDRRGPEGTKAHAVCTDHALLPSIIDSLSGK